MIGDVGLEKRDHISVELFKISTFALDGIEAVCPIRELRPKVHLETAVEGRVDGESGKLSGSVGRESLDSKQY